jgi:xanthine dehydrogenase accessory factor
VKALFGQLKKQIQAGEDCVLVTVIASSGSIPREAGARMLVSRQGRLRGTIGGGAVEHRAEQLAAQVLVEKKSCFKSFKLARNDVEDLGMICGGDVNLYFQLVSASEPRNLSLVDAILEAFERDEDVWLVTDLTDACEWSMGVFSHSHGLTGLSVPAEQLAPLWKTRAVQQEIGGRHYYSEPLVRSGRVVIFGGGHVAQELVPVLAHVGFRCVVIDDRPDFASKELFPSAAKVIQGDFTKISESIKLTPADYVVVMTRGHAHDFAVQEQVLRAELAYVGVIGSRSKSAAIKAKLAEAGVPQAAIDRIHTPIGTPIKAETPAEIAISIAGELILTRAERTGIRAG